MMPWLSSLFLVGGAALCLLAAAGVLRLPDFFMRMHAATKAGVVGCGLVLIGAGLADGTAGTWVKVGIALAFLLLTTPVAGHLLGRAAYVAGAPLWQGTTSDDLRTVLPRGQFGAGIRTVREPTPGAWAVTASSWRSRRVRTWRPPSGRPSRWRANAAPKSAAWRSSTSRACATSDRSPSAPAGMPSRCGSGGSVWHARRRQTSSSASRRWPAHRACAGRFAWRRDGRRRSWQRLRTGLRTRGRTRRLVRPGRPRSRGGCETSPAMVGLAQGHCGTGSAT